MHVHVLTPLHPRLPQFELEDDLAELDAELERDATAANVAPVAAAPVAAPAPASTHGASVPSGSASANAAATALPMAPMGQLPVPSGVQQAKAPAAVAAGGGGAGGGDEMDDELRRLEAEMGM